MAAFRTLLALVALGTLSIGSGRARSQPAGDPDDPDEGAGSAAGPKLTAPADPKARPAWLRDRVTAALANPKLARAKLAVAVVDLATSEELVALNADKGMNLASNTKVLTSAAALSALGPGFRWRTVVYGAEPDERGNVADLYVRGRGDPLLSAADLRALADDLFARGVRSADRIVLDATYFDDQAEPPHFSDAPNEQAAYRAPVASFSVARGAVNVVIIAEPSGAAARVTLEPDAGDAVKITKKEIVSLAKDAPGRTRVRVEAKAKRDHLEIEATGQLRVGEGSYEVRKRVDDPARFAVEVFRKILAERGIKIAKRSVARAPVPLTGVKVLAAHDSAALDDVLRAMNKHSDNYVAESVLKTLGAETKQTPGPATWADGLAAVRAYLAKLGVAPAAYKLENGSGLYASTEVSAKQLVAVLRAAHRDYRVGPALVGSLPIGGVDGTLAKRWRGHAAAGRVRAKTGTLDKVVTLAGFIAADSQHALAFAVLANEIPAGQRPTVRAAADEIVDALAAYLAAP